MNKSSNQTGFTLLEVLLVVGIISLLAGIVVLAINPSKQLGDTRNATRRADVNTILNAIYQYEIDNNGSVPPVGGGSAISSTATEICKIGGTCTGLIDLTALTTNGKYLVSIPVDPAGGTANSTKYSIASTNNRFTVAAVVTDNGATISATR